MVLTVLLTIVISIVNMIKTTKPANIPAQLVNIWAKSPKSDCAKNLIARFSTKFIKKYIEIKNNPIVI